MAVISALGFLFHAHWSLTTATDLHDAPPPTGMVVLDGELGTPTVHEQHSRHRSSYRSASAAVTLFDASASNSTAKAERVHCPVTANHALHACVRALQQLAGEPVSVTVVEHPRRHPVRPWLIVSIKSTRTGATHFSPRDIGSAFRESALGVMLVPVAVLLIVLVVLVPIVLVLRRRRNRVSDSAVR